MRWTCREAERGREGVSAGGRERLVPGICATLTVVGEPNGQEHIDNIVFTKTKSKSVHPVAFSILLPISSTARDGLAPSVSTFVA